ncbi:MAG: CocE/NonD family hydrolase [Actinobacteria bacterium]|nr:CocE/NonD family hydrolase [Actinomycetota bacterium]
MPHDQNVSEQLVFIDVEGDVRVAAKLYLPTTEAPFATLVEALPYRQHDITASYADSYRRFVGEGEFAVVRVDLRGTGASGGVAEDEYPDIERRDLRVVIEWIAAQPWSSGKVGLFGTSYSGFNSLHMAMEGVPQLGAVVATYATDDRYSDDVHYCGGVLRAIDLIDYPLYMIAMNGLPPTPAVWAQSGAAHDWLDEWRRRIADNEPWLLEWLRHPLPDATWRRGSVRLGPTNEGYRRMKCPVLLIAGWADGYRNNTFRTIHEMPNWRLIAGPWSHKDPSTARPGPNIDSDLEIMRFFDQHLRGGPRATARRGQIFVRRPTPPAPDLAVHDGHWIEVDTWPAIEVKEDPRRTRADNDEVDETDVPGDVGIMAWNSCAGALPWGQPLDQRPDNARSITYDWLHKDEMILLGNCEVTMQVRSSAAVGHISVKLCDVAPDGTSTLITRGMLDLTQRGVWPSDPYGEVGAAPAAVTPGEWMDLKLQFEATTWTLLPGHRIRLAIAGTDWPNCWPAAQPFTLGVRRKSVRLVMWTAKSLPAARDIFEPGRGPADIASESKGVEWRYEHDVLARETRVHTRYGGDHEGTDGTRVTDAHEGSLGVSTIDLSRAWAVGRSRFELTIPEFGTCTTEATLNVRSDREWFHVEIELRAERDGEPVGKRRWTERFPR